MPYFSLCFSNFPLFMSQPMFSIHFLSVFLYLLQFLSLSMFSVDFLSIFFSYFCDFCHSPCVLLTYCLCFFDFYYICRYRRVLLTFVCVPVISVSADVSLKLSVRVLYFYDFCHNRLSVILFCLCPCDSSLRYVCHFLSGC